MEARTRGSDRPAGRGGMRAWPEAVTQRGAARLEEQQAVGSLTKHSAQHPA